MAYNGSGTFVRSHNWVTDKTNVVPVTASRMDTECDGFATGLTTALCKDGQQTATARIPFALGASSMDGSVSSASYAHVSDLNTGLYFPAADQWGLSAGGVGTLTSTSTAVSLGTSVTLTLSGALTVSSGGLIVTGNSTITGTLNVTSDFSVATNKFNVAAASGDTLVAGTLGVTGVATLASASITGAATVGTTLGITGTTTAAAINGTAITASGALSGATAAGAQIATQAEQETGTATDKLVTPGRQHFHQCGAKAWAKFVADGSNGAATVSSSYNITGVNKDSTGTYTVTIANDFSSANYVVVVTPLDSGSNIRISRLTSQAAGTFVIKVRDASNTDQNPEFVMFACYGDI